MPVYQYACTECGEQLEVRQSFTDAALTECPVCEGRLRKMLNAVGVVFKGSGFYRNDSRAAAGGGAESPSGADGATSGDGASTTGNAEKKESSTSSESNGSPSKGSMDKGSGSTGRPSGGSSGGSSGRSSGGPKPAPAPTH